MGKSGKTSTKKTASARRREELRRTLGKPTFDPRAILQRPELMSALLVMLLTAGLMTWVTSWARDQNRVKVGQMMTETRLARLDFDVLDQAKTEEERELQRRRQSYYFELNRAYLDALQAPLLNLPLVVASAPDLASINEQVRNDFQLDEAGLKALRAYAADGRVTPEWQNWVDTLLTETMPRHPLLTRDEWEKQANRGARPFFRDENDRPIANWLDTIQIRDGTRDEQLLSELAPVVREAGFPDAASRYVAARLASQAQPTFVVDTSTTESALAQAAANVEPVIEHHVSGEIIYRRGEVLGAKQYQVLLAEEEQFARVETWAAKWRDRVGLAGLILLATSTIAAYIAMFYQRIVTNIWRVTAIGVVMCGTLALSVIIATEAPAFVIPATIAPTLLAATVMLLAYGQRFSLFLAAMQSALVTFALDQNIAMFILLFSGCAAMISQLREMRHRASLIRAASVTAFVIGLGTVVLGLVRFPEVQGNWNLIILDTIYAIGASYLVGFLVLGILPSIEQMFDITTGMTLAELRDQRNSLLRQLQQRAPGTYNHSLQVANIAEAAAEAVGADGLLVYVGALYHDIGKMNKPEYFVENLTSGYNRHEKLSPTMSTLVIVGHVKDGIELAREYALPRPLQHFIESHHGTTLVEYFYHAAKTKAGAGDRETVKEVEFRYPGPKPHTKEAAIMMLSDCVESATRAMPDPTPGRIENLVRSLSRKRLEDGQFNQCDLTFRELKLVEDSIIKSVCAIYHGRIAYPTEKGEKGDKDKKDTPPATRTPPATGATPA